MKKDLLLIPNLGNSSFFYELMPKFLQNTEKYVTIQASLLYTSFDGIRVIRILNHQVLADDNLKMLLESINLDVLINLLMKQSLALILKNNVLLSGQKFLEAKTIEIMKNCLIVFNEFPQNLSEFVLKILGLMKHPLFVNKNLPCKCN